MKPEGWCGTQIHKPVGRPEKIPGKLVIGFDKSIVSPQLAIAVVGMADVELETFNVGQGPVGSRGTVKVPAGQEAKFAVRLKQREGVEWVEFETKHETMEPMMQDQHIPAEGIVDEHGLSHGNIGSISLPGTIGIPPKDPQW